MTANKVIKESHTTSQEGKVSLTGGGKIQVYSSPRMMMVDSDGS